MTNAADRARHAQAVGEILAFMSKCGLALDDLIQISGDDLKSSNPKRAEKARRVSKCWELMARLSVCFADLEQVSRLERHEGDVATATSQKLLKTHGFL